MRLDVVGACESPRIIVVGEVDSLTAAGLAGCLADVQGRPGVTEVVVDLRAVSFLNSAGLCVLAGAHRVAGRGGQVLRVDAGSNRSVLRPLQITGLWDRLA